MEDTSSFAELQKVGCDAANDCQSGDSGYFAAAAKDTVNIVKDCN